MHHRPRLDVDDGNPTSAELLLKPKARHVEKRTALHALDGPTEPRERQVLRPATQSAPPEDCRRVFINEREASIRKGARPGERAPLCSEGARAVAPDRATRAENENVLILSIAGLILSIDAEYGRALQRHGGPAHSQDQQETCQTEEELW